MTDLHINGRVITDPRYNLVGIAEISERLDMSKQRIANWAKRYHDFPTPLASLHMGNVYYWPDIIKWCLTTGRGNISITQYWREH